MKKTTLFTATTLSILCLGGQVLTVHAAPKNLLKMDSNGNRVVVSYNTCNTQGLADLLKDCFPNLCLPGIYFPEAGQPDCNIPESNLPDSETPDIESPDVELPDAETPDVECPDTETPDVEFPDAETPEIEFPDMDAPENNAPDIPNTTPDNDQPGNNTPDTETPDDTITENPEVSPYIAEIVSLVNAERAKEGLSPLTINVQVQAAAQVRARECEQSFSHTRPNGSSFATALKEQNVSYRSAGENIAWGQRSPEEVMNAWMNSEGHRANIMNPNFTSIGVGYYQNANGTNYWCQLFIR